MHRPGHIGLRAALYLLLALACQLAAMATSLHGLAHGGEHHGGHDCAADSPIELSAGLDWGHGEDEPFCAQCRAGLRSATALPAAGWGIRPVPVFTPLPDTRATAPFALAIGLKPLRGPPVPTPSGVHR